MSAARVYRGFSLHTDVIYHDDIRRYAPGVKVEKDGWFTQRIALEPQYCDFEAEANDRSLVLGEQFIDRHLVTNDVLHFDYLE